MRLARLLLTAFALVGCEATTTEQRARDWQSQMRSALQPAAECGRRVREDPSHAIVYERLPDLISRPAATLAQRGNAARPTADEAAAVERWHADSAVCMQMALSVLDRGFPDLARIIESAAERQDRVLQSVVKREIRWADANERLRESRASYRSDLEALRQRGRASYANARAREVQQRNAALGAVLGALGEGAAGAAEYAAARRPLVIVPVQPTAPPPARLQTTCRYIGPPYNETQCN